MVESYPRLWFAFRVVPERKYDLDVARVANLARLRLEPAEADAFRPQLERVLEYVAELQLVDT